MDRKSQSRRREGTLAVAFFVGILLLAALGYQYHRGQVLEFRQVKLDELDAIANLKMEQIRRWRQEHLATVAAVLDLPSLARQAQALIDQPDDTQARAAVEAWMRRLAGRLRYQRIRLVDPRMVTLMTWPAGAPGEPAVCREAVQGLSGPGLLLSDLHRGAPGQPAHLDVVAPLWLDPDDPNPAGPEPGPVGLLVCELSAEVFPYPVLARWPAPTPSATAEIELVRREGNDVLYLNELRHCPGTAMRLRFPMSRKDLPAVQAVLGQRATLEEKDYRGHLVLAAHRRVPESPWYLVVKMDLAEIYAPLEGRGMIAAATVLGLALLAGFGLRMAWQGQKLEYTRNELAAERQRQALAQRVTLLLKQANDAILLTDSRWQIADANDRALELYGYTAEELKGLSLRELHAAEARGQFDGLAPARMPGSITETSHRAKDGSVFPVEISARTVEFEGQPFHQFIVRDIRERRHKEAEIRRLNRLYAVLSEVSQAIVRVSSREGILQKVCDIAVRDGGFQLAWIGWLDPKTNVIEPCARAGEASGSPDPAELAADTRPGWGSLAGAAILQEAPCVLNDLFRDPRAASAEGWPSARGFLSGAAFPLRSPQGQAAGALTLYSSERACFTAGEVALLSEVAEDVSFALRHLDHETRRRQAEAALRRERDFIARTLETIGALVVTLDPEGRIQSANRAALETLGCAAEALSHRRFTEFLARPEEAAGVEAVWSDLRAGLCPRQHQNHWVSAQGRRRLILWSSTAQLGERGAVEHFIATGIDITEHYEAETARQSTEARLRAIIEQAPSLAVQAFDEKGRIVLWNPAASVLYGWTQSEALGQPLGALLRDPAGAAEYGARLDALAAGRQAPLRGEYEIRAKDGRVVTVDSTLFEIPGAEGRRQFIGMDLDVTERKRAAAQLLAYREQLDAVLKSIPLPMFAKDSQGRYLLVNPALCRFLGAPPNKLLGRSVEECYPSELAAIFHQRDLDLMARDDVQVYEHWMNDAQGRRREVLFSKACFHDAQGQVIGLVGTMTDITERKRTEESLRALVAGTAAVSGLDFFRSLVSHLAGALGVRYAFVAELASPQAPQAHVLQLWTGGQLAGPMDYDLAGTPCQTVLRDGLACYPRAVQAAFPNSPLLRELGVESYLGAALYDDRKTPLGLLVVMHDQPLVQEEFFRSILTIFASRAGVEVQRIRAERRILELNRGLERRVQERTAELTASNQELEAFSYSVSHDLRAPLRHVAGFVELLREHLAGKLDEASARHMRIIINATQEMARLIDDLLAFSRVGRVEMHKSRVDLSELAAQARESLSAECAGRPIQWTLAPLPSVTGDPALLRLALVNLLSNAVKYTRGRDPAQIEIGCVSGAPGEVVVFVRDNGAGFDMRFVAKLFGVFQRLHRASEYEGTGIGLANVRRIIQRHGGRVWAEGAVGQGATFWLTLPAGA